MGKRGKKKEAPVSYEFISEVSKMSKEQIVTRFLQEENDINALKEKQKSAKKFKSTNKREELDNLSSDATARLEAIEEEIDELKAERKELKSGTAEGEREEDDEALKQAAKDLGKEVKQRMAARNYLYTQLNVAFGIQMTVKPE